MLNMYTSKAEIEKYMLLNIDSSFDAQIDEWIETMSRQIDRMTNRTFVVPTEETEMLYDGNNIHQKYFDDFFDLTELRIDNQVIDADEYAVYPANQQRKKYITLKYRVFNYGLQNVKLTAKFGFPEIPLEIRWACTVLVSGIINASNQHSNEVQQESIGQYSVTYNTEKQFKDFQEANKIIMGYKRHKTI